MEIKEFAALTIDSKHEIFIIYVAFLGSILLNVYFFYKTQKTGLIAQKTPTKVFAKYIDFADTFFPDLTFQLLKHTRINNHIIKLVNGQQLFYGLIYNREPIELKILKAYIETNLANGFNKPFKSFASAFIFFNQNLDRSL